MLNPPLETPNTAWHWTSAHVVKQSHRIFADFWLEITWPEEFSACKSYETLSFSPSFVDTWGKVKSNFQLVKVMKHSPFLPAL